MPSEKLRRILIARSPFTKEQIETMSDHDGWAWVYTHKHVGARVPPRLEVCLTGFSAEEKALLASETEQAGFKVVTKVTKHLAFLCVGDDPGPAKLALAREQVVPVLDREQLRNLIENGEIPMEQ
ncbi:MAG: hypothetical protein IT347_09630 [Candidatus Eisenbacteria bacterium]|nr:hypothetical protein [Candidatus Eisenbacteria bacterium]